MHKFYTSTHRFVLPTLVGILLVLLWALASGTGYVSQALLPQPASVMQSGVVLIDSGELYVDVASTLVLMGQGIAFGLMLGFPIGIVVGLYTPLRRMLWPYIQAVRSLPAVALIPIVLVLVPGAIGRPLIIGISCAAIIAVSIAEGAHTASKERSDFIQTADLTRVQLFFSFYIPEIAHQFFIGLRIVAGLALVLAVVLEMLLGDLHGLGVFISNHAVNDRPGVFVVVIVLALLGILINTAIEQLARLVVFWK